ncbi:sedoheptulokinase-like isoform X2 [Coccinella septempunctata]|uniref:sedoheptulokinase-like isoform X2 n=1 Tax=Coccinella septempunctata TaxID=41139 RepID=UPI001D092742|nr:sedoheptulokinase-like isoform X2 [Coccinella septempunctata]
MLKVDMDGYALGIDIGTTSVKVCVLNLRDNVVVAEQSKDTQSNVPSDQGIDGNKQDVPKILSAINTCVAKFSKDLLQQVIRIGVCGQMHGVMFWQHKSSKAWERIEKDGMLVRYDVKPDQVSNLYTWQDNRCTREFLDTLPKPDSHLRVYSGFGIATMFWMIKNRPDEMEKYNRAGTIQDFAVSMLCDSDTHYISEQNAASWGYFNCRTYKWNLEMLEEAGFPIEILPEIKMSGQIAGYLADTWHSIPQGTPIGIAMGDLQCSVLSTIEEGTDATLNISTSAQIAYVVNKKLQDDELGGPPKETSMTYLPYFNNTFLAVAASLNGGNSLATFVRVLQQWILEFGFSIPQGKVWTKLIDLSKEEKAYSDLEVNPTCWGERHNPELTASVSNINVGNLGLGQVFKAMCEGLIKNLHSMMPKEVLEDASVKRIVCSGSGITRNETLQNAVKDIYGLPFKLAKGSDAAKGAAMAMKPTEIQ